MLFNEARPVSPGAPYYLSPASATGLDQNTVDVHARSSYLGAAVTGPQMGSFQAGGMAMVFFYNDNVLADQYGGIFLGHVSEPGFHAVVAGKPHGVFDTLDSQGRVVGNFRGNLS